MNIKRIGYWIFTGLLSAMMLLSAYMYLSHNPMMMGKFRELGYPEYFPNLLGVSKIVGVLVLLAPGLKVVKEWAYAGFGITFAAAVFSHVSSNDAKSAVAPVVAFVFLLASYYLRPWDRRVVETPMTPVAVS